MRIPAILATLMVLTTTQFARADDDVLAPAREGKIGCYSPDSEKKTCAATLRFEWDQNGNIIEVDEGPVSANPLIIEQVKDFATIEGGAICQIGTEGTFRTMTYYKNGVQLTGQDAEAFLQARNAIYVSFVGKKVCMDISPYDSVFITQITIDGSPKPSLTNRMKWISPDEGYVLAPL